MSWAPKQTVIAPVDFSDASYNAVEVARKIVADPSGLHIVHVIPSPTLFEPASLINKLDHSATYHASMEAIRQHLGEKYQESQVNVLFGDPGSEIAAFADRLNADLIVISSHGRGGVKRILLGSVAERVLQLARCPVLVLRREE